MSERPNPLGNDDEWNMLHYAVGILQGIASRYGLIDVSIYYDSIHVVIEPVVESLDGVDERPDFLKGE